MVDIENSGRLKELLKALSEDYANGKFTPILEADIVGYLYYLWISKFDNASKVHLNTRICGLVGKRRKFDFVAGDVKSGELLKLSNEEFPCVDKPWLVIEVKSFLNGFKGSQLKKRYRYVEGDLRKLAKLGETSNERYILFFDERNYLERIDKKRRSSRINSIVELRNKLDSNIKIIHVKTKKEKDKKVLTWNFL